MVHNAAYLTGNCCTTGNIHEVPVFELPSSTCESISCTRPRSTGPVQISICKNKCRFELHHFFHESLILLHVILGRGKQLLRAHEKVVHYFWNRHNAGGAKFEGLLPAHAFAFVKEYLLELERLQSLSTTKLARLLKAVARIWRRKGGQTLPLSTWHLLVP